MKLNFIKFLLLILFTTRIFSQVENPFFDKMEGLWEAYYELDGKNLVKELYMSWELKHNFFRIQLEQRFVKDNKEILILTFDKENNAVGCSFDTNGYESMIQYKGKAEGNKMILMGFN